MLLAAKIWRITFWITSIAVALVSWRFLALGMEAAFANLPYQVEQQRLLFTTHVVFGPIALMIAPFQLMTRLRVRRPALHRWMGVSYCLAVLLGGVSGFLIGFGANGGLLTKAGFIILAVLWLWTTLRAYQFARARRFDDHRAWMIRSIALTFAGVALRFWLPVQLISGIPFETAYAVVAWLCWVPNVLIAEYYLSRSKNLSVQQT